MRLALGTVLERFGLVNVQCGVMSFEAFWVAVVAAITASWDCALVCFFMGCAGAMFVTNQFWCSLAFAPNVCGTASAIAAGWSSLGGGVTQIFTMLVLFNLTVASGMEPNIAWRVSMVVPAVMLVMCAICMKLMCWDIPTARNHDPAVTGNAQRPSLWDYVDVLRDVRVVVMIFQYSVWFGTELAKNKHLVKHFRTYFQMDASNASALAGAFGLMNPNYLRTDGKMTVEALLRCNESSVRVSDRAPNVHGHSALAVWDLPCCLPLPIPRGIGSGQCSGAGTFESLLRGVLLVVRLI